MSRLTIELPDELQERLAAEARRLRKRPGQLVQEAVEARLRNGEKSFLQTVYELSQDLCGSVSGGPRDLARNKRHLKGYG